MAEYSIPYGKTNLTFQLADTQVHVLGPSALPVLENPAQAAAQAIDQPLGNIRLSDFASARSVAIAINDKTRPVPLGILLPPLLERFAELGIPRNAVTLLIATGTHAPVADDEFPALLPPSVLGSYRVVSHNCDDASQLVYLGETSRGTPIRTNATFVRADLRIAVGNLEPHQFQGFSGGAKPAAIGLSGRDTITHNHSMMLDPRANIARYEDNPARQDVEEIGERIGVHFALNAIVNESKQVVAVLAGDPRAVMRAGIPRVLELYERRVGSPFDLVITSPGGHPKDINLYQAQKALAHAMIITRPGGTVILAAACPEGTGSKHYEEWMADKTSHAQVIEAFRREGYKIGAHKAFQISRDALRARVLFVSDMPKEMVQKLLLTPFSSLDAALQTALRDLPASGRIGILPYANATIPVLA